MKQLLLIFQFFLLSLAAFAQVDWINIKEVTTQLVMEKKPIVLFIHTDWCKICKMQEETVFSDEIVAKHINTQFYALNLNAEEKQSLTFLGRTYAGATANRYHELAEYLGKSNKEFYFPTLIILNEQLEVVYKKAGLVSKEEWAEWMERTY
ncbi:thioredoxin family protein [bacterium]|nr:thioredoxin family protein [bacterium]